MRYLQDCGGNLLYIPWNKKNNVTQTRQWMSLPQGRGVIRSGRQPRVRRRKKMTVFALFTNKATHKFEWHHNCFSAHHNLPNPRPHQREVCITTPNITPLGRFRPSETQFVFQRNTCSWAILYFITERFRGRNSNITFTSRQCCFPEYYCACGYSVVHGRPTVLFFS